MVEAGNRGPVNHFRGRSDHVLDDKGRLSIASRFREVLRRQNEERLMVLPWKNCLRVYPLSQWEEIELTLRATERKTPAMIKLTRYMSLAEECCLDKQGRMLLPAKLRSDSNIGKEIALHGMLTYFEIWDKTVWAEVEQPAPEEFDRFDETLLDVGIL